MPLPQAVGVSFQTTSIADSSAWIGLIHLTVLAVGIVWLFGTSFAAEYKLLAVLTLFHCTRSRTTTSSVTHIKKHDIFLINIKDWDICLGRWKPHGNCTRAAGGKGSRSLRYVAHRNGIGIRDTRGKPCRSQKHSPLPCGSSTRNIKSSSKCC